MGKDHDLDHFFENDLTWEMIYCQGTAVVYEVPICFHRDFRLSHFLFTNHESRM